MQALRILSPSQVVRAAPHIGCQPSRHLRMTAWLLNSNPSSSSSMSSPTTPIPPSEKPSDLWGPLPNTPEHIQKTASPDSLVPPPRLERRGEDVATLRARLTYQARKRGTLESDLLLSTFANEYMGTMSEAELLEFDRLMDEPDWDIYYWATEKRAPPERWHGSVLLERLKVHVRNEGKVVRRMPDLPDYSPP